MTTIARSIRPHSTTHRRLRRAVTVLAVVVSALAGWAVAGPLLGVDLTVDMGDGRPPMTVGFGPVAVTSLLAALAGWASLAVLERFTGRARTVWTTVAVVVLLLSFLPLAGAGAAAAAKVALGALHLVVAAVLILGLTLPRPGPRTDQIG